MKRMLFFLALLIHFPQNYGQSTLCDCCTYESLQWTDDFEKWFPPAGIVRDKIKNLTIYTTSKQSESANDTIWKVVNHEYKEMELEFNENGYVIERTYFNRLGKFHRINEFERDSNNRIVSKTLFYLDDSTGVKDESFLPEKWIYSYKRGVLAKMKRLGDNFANIPDNRTEYFSFKYDSMARVIKTVHYNYYNGQHPNVFISRVYYYGPNKARKTVTRHNGKILLNEETLYYAENKPDFTHKYDGRYVRIGSLFYTYDERNQLIGFKTRNYGMFTECPDKGNISDIYKYSDTNLLIGIEHYYQNTCCSSRIEFN
jgi:hypothetical protein